MRLSLVALGILAAAPVIGCGASGKSPPPAVQARARVELEARGRSDQAVRQGFGVGGTINPIQLQAMLHTDSTNTVWLKGYVQRWGWPTSEQVGRPAVQAAFLIVQHATHDTAFMRAMLPSIEDAYRRGDLEGEAVALLTDRVATGAGQPQIYGTQLSLRDGRWVVDTIADSAHVDERRRAMGMPPLSTYVQRFDSLTTPR